MEPIPGVDIAARRRRRRRRAVLSRLVGIIVLVGLGVGGYLLYLQRGAPVTAPRPVPERVPGTPAPPSGPLAGAPATMSPSPGEEPLPSLAESDPLVRRLLSGVTPQPPPAAWLSSGGLIERFVAAVDNVASGESPRPNLLFLAPGRKFEVVRRGEHVYIDPASYERYDAVAELVGSVDPQRAVDLYRQVSPLCEEAYRALGHGEGGFDQALGRAIRMLLATPIVEGEVELGPQVVTFAFADTALEELAPCQKQLLRMGPRNVRRVRAELRALAVALGIPGADLPAEVIHRGAGRVNEGSWRAG